MTSQMQSTKGFQATSPLRGAAPERRRWASMTKALLVAAVVSLTSCATMPTTAPEVLVGRWVLANESKSALPPDCADIRMEITVNERLIINSGAFVGEAAIKILAKDNGFELALTLLTHNGEPNCQGRTAEYVSQHFAPTLFLEPAEDKLQYYMIDKAFGPPMLMERE